MDKDLPAVLLVGGGEGMGPVEQTARALGESLYDANTGKALGQLVVVCGRNKGLVKKLQKIQWNIPVKVLNLLNASNFCFSAIVYPYLYNTLAIIPEKVHRFPLLKGNSLSINESEDDIIQYRRTQALIPIANSCEISS